MAQSLTPNFVACVKKVIFRPCAVSISFIITHRIFVFTVIMVQSISLFADL